MSVAGFRRTLWILVVFTAVALAAGYAARWELKWCADNGVGAVERTSAI